MGNIIKRVWSSFFNMQRDVKILMVGLDAAGKTTILYQLKLGELVTPIPTIGFNVEEVNYKNLKLTMWDVGGQKRLRELWNHYLPNNDAIIYVVDSSDTERMENECLEELQYLVGSEDLKDACILIYANKQDMPGALNLQELTEKL